MYSESIAIKCELCQCSCCRSHSRAVDGQLSHLLLVFVLFIPLYNWKRLKPELIGIEKFPYDLLEIQINYIKDFNNERNV
jgi:hypothetical protein